MAFVLNERLARGGFEIGTYQKCRLILKDESNFPWMILVPEVDCAVEDLHQLDEEMFQSVMSLLKVVSQFMEIHFRLEKLNVACIGNVVRQMHIHVVARSSSDKAWPGVVWAFDQKQTYQTKQEVEEIMQACRDFLEESLVVSK